MEKSKKYRNTLFTVETIKKAIEVYDASVKEAEIENIKSNHPKVEKASNLEKFFNIFSRYMNINTLEVQWDYDSEDEFFADYRKYKPEGANYSSARYSRNRDISRLTVSVYGSDTTISVLSKCPVDNRSIIEKVFDIFETDALRSKIPYKLTIKPKIFIGHGRNFLWRDLKDHLQDKQGFEIVAYEVGTRAGHTIRDILENMLSQSSFALLVMTAEDETADGTFRARQNVIHETGLFQGKLGFNKAVILLEEGTEEFSNMQGVEQIRFSTGNIKETYGDVLATIKREFY